MGKEITKLINRALSWNRTGKKSNRDLQLLRPTPETKTIHVLHETTNYIPARTSRASPGAPCMCLRYLSRLSDGGRQRLLGGDLYHHCPTGVSQFKKAGRWSRTPGAGAVIFFTNGQRSHHTGIVTEVTSSRVKTIEGNTSGASGVIPNGWWCLPEVLPQRLRPDPRIWDPGPEHRRRAGKEIRLDPGGRDLEILSRRHRRGGTQ